MTAAPSSSSGRMDWHNGVPPPQPQPQPPHGYNHHHQSYEAYQPPRNGPPLTPGSTYQYSPQRPGPPPRIHPPKYWHEQQQRRPPPQSFGPPPPYDSKSGSSSSSSSSYGDGRQGPPTANPGYPYDYYHHRSQRRDLPPSYQLPTPTPSSAQYRTPPSHLRRTGSESAASVTNSASFSSKEEIPEVERNVPSKSSDWEPTRSSSFKPSEKGKKSGDSLSLLAKVAMEPLPSDPPSKSEAAVDDDPTSPDKPVETSQETLTSPPSKDDSEKVRPQLLRSSPIVAPDVVPPSTTRPPPPVVYRDATNNNNTVTPKPITPTGVTHYGQPPSALASHPPPPQHPHAGTHPHHHHHHHHHPHRPSPYGGAYDDRGGPYPPPPSYGMTPPHGSASVNYGPPPPGTYPSGYDSRSGSWEQPYIPPASPAVVVEERNSFDSYESSGNSRGSSNYYNHPYPAEYSRGYPPYPPTPHGATPWPPPQHAPGPGYSFPSWGYEPPPHHHGGYPQQHHMTPPRIMGGPTPPYYEDRASSVSSYPHHIQPSPYGPPPPHAHAHHHHVPHHHHHRPMYPYMLPPSEEKTVLRKKFSWKHFPELERFLIENRDDYLKFSSRNYTVEQKQFNNTLTERLIVLAEKHAYVFDPEEFNFVAIRDRIRCYYKSYVQTARKRGLMLPTDKVTTTMAAVPSSRMPAIMVRHHDDDHDDDPHDDDGDEAMHDAGNDGEEGVEVDENGVPSPSRRAAPVRSVGGEESRE